MSSVAIIYSNERIDFYKGGQFSYSIPRVPGATIPKNTDEEIEAFISEPSLLGEFEAAFCQTTYCPIAGPALVETDHSLIYLDDENLATVIPLSELFSELIVSLCGIVDRLQTQNGFFSMIPNQLQSLRDYLYALLMIISSVPDTISVPVFAWFNYAQADEATIEEKNIRTYIEIPYELVDRNLPVITSFLLNNGIKKAHGRHFIKNAILRKALESLSL